MSVGSRVAPVVTALVVLAACSGGSSHGGTTSSSRGASTVPVTTVAPKPTTTTVPVVHYRVKPGETLGVIARRFHVTIVAIAKRNHIANPDQVAEGTVLVIPPPVPVRLVITPARGPLGTTFHLRLQGADPGETVQFTIVVGRTTYKGALHDVDPDGTVKAEYHTSDSDPTGTYRVSANGSNGTKASASFVVVSASSTTPST